MRLLRFFFIGSLSAFGALFLELLLEIFLSPTSTAPAAIPTHVSALLISSILIEEGTKYGLLSACLGKLFSERTVLRPSLAFAAGFGFSETALIFFTAPVIIYSALAGTFLLHVLTIGWASLFFKFFPSPRFGIISILTFAAMAAIHLGYNTLVVYNFSTEILYVYLALLGLVLFILHKPFQSMPRSNAS